MKSIEHLEFDSKRITVLLSNGEWYVAIKPIYTALGVNFKYQYEVILQDEELSQLSCQCGTVAADGKIRKMLCLPEKYIYGWLFGIKSDAVGMKEYRRECYNVLYNHFHGMMTDRMSKLTEKTEALELISERKSELLESETYKDIVMAEKRIRMIDKSLKAWDHDLLTGQTAFDFQSEN